MAGYPPPPPAPGTGYQPPVVAPGMIPTPGTVMLSEWNNGLCGCLSDIGGCCYGFWCQPCMFGSNTAKIEGGGCCAPCCIYTLLSLICCQGVYAQSVRRKLREQHALKGDCLGACCAYTFCGACATCQDGREIKERQGSNSNTGGQFMTSTSPPPAQKMVQ